jgi:hypothetical protein
LHLLPSAQKLAIAQALHHRASAIKVRAVAGALRQRSPLLLRHIVVWGDYYLAPRTDAAVTVGAANDYAGYAASYLTAAGTAELLAQALTAAPTLE